MRKAIPTHPLCVAFDTALAQDGVLPLRRVSLCLGHLDDQALDAAAVALTAAGCTIGPTINDSVTIHHNTPLSHDAMRSIASDAATAHLGFRVSFSFLPHLHKPDRTSPTLDDLRTALRATSPSNSSRYSSDDGDDSDDDNTDDAASAAPATSHASSVAASLSLGSLSLPSASPVSHCASPSFSALETPSSPSSTPPSSPLPLVVHCAEPPPPDCPPLTFLPPPSTQMPYFYVPPPLLKVYALNHPRAFARPTPYRPAAAATLPCVTTPPLPDFDTRAGRGPGPGPGRDPGPGPATPPLDTGMRERPGTRGTWSSIHAAVGVVSSTLTRVFAHLRGRFF